MQLSVSSFRSEASLRQELFARVQETEPPPPCGPADPEHRWRYASALQKSVRRGHTACAIRFAQLLHDVDPQYCWKRLCIIALEDCFGDPVACALTLEANRHFRFRQVLGELWTLAAVVTGLAEGVKSRALTDSLVARGQGYTHPPARSFKLHAQLQAGMPWLATYLTLRGMTHAQLGYEVPVVWERLTAQWRFQDRMNAEAGVGPAPSPFAHVIENAPDPHGDELITGLPAAAWDQYTREGQRAIRYLKACKLFRSYTPQQIGLFLFYVEGAHLDRSLGGWKVGELDVAAKRVDHAGVNLSEEQGAQLKQLLIERRELVNYARKRVLP